MPNVNFNPKVVGPAAPTAPAKASEPCPPVLPTKPAEAPAAGETLQKAQAAQGKAKTSLEFFSFDGENTKAWKTAGAKGEKVPLDQTSKDRLGTLKSLVSHIQDSPKFTPEQKKNFSKFIQDFRDASTSDNPLNKVQHLERFNSLLKSQGLSSRQLDMILDGSFSGKQLHDMSLEAIVI